MSDNKKHVVTGVSGFTGQHIAKRLLAADKRVVNLTGHPDRPTEFGDRITSVPYNFDDPTSLTASLEGSDVLYSTYWIRFARGSMTFDKAVRNSKTLVQAAKDAGVRRIVHVSITNPSEDSRLPYFSGKAVVEKAIIDSGLSYAILRPAVIFGDQGILINNIAWFLRHLPVFGIPGSGQYMLQPVYVEDLADLAVAKGQSTGSEIIDAVGPEAVTFNELVHLISQAVGSRTIIAHLPAELALLATGLAGMLLGDVVMTRDEAKGLLANLLISEHAATCPTRLSEWIKENASWLGTSYQSEVAKHYR